MMLRLIALPLFCLALYAIAPTPSSAQIPLPQADSDMPVQHSGSSVFAEPYREEPLPQIPDFTAEFLMPFDRKNEIVQPTRRYRPNQEAALQEMRSHERKMDAQAGGFQWFSLRDAGKPTFEYLEKRGADKNALIKAMDYTDITITDLDGDNQPDIIVQHWDWISDCGISGCVYDVYFGNTDRTPESVMAQRVLLHARGLLVDNGFIVYRSQLNRRR